MIVMETKQDRLDRIEKWYANNMNTLVKILQSDKAIQLQDPKDPDNRIELIGRELSGFKQGLSFAMNLFGELPQEENDE